MKKKIETINKGQEEIKNTISELKNTVEGTKADLTKQRIRSASWRTNYTKKNTQKEQEKEKRHSKN